MAYEIYTFSLKSQEQEGATKPNIIRIGLNSEADADQFKTNLENAFSADVVTVNKVLQSDYSLPYPDGTDAQARMAVWDVLSQTTNLRLRDWKHDTNVIDFADALVAAGLKTGPNGDDQPAVSVNVTIFRPTQFQ